MFELYVLSCLPFGPLHFYPQPAFFEIFSFAQAIPSFSCSGQKPQSLPCFLSFICHIQSVRGPWQFISSTPISLVKVTILLLLDYFSTLLIGLCYPLLSILSLAVKVILCVRRYHFSTLKPPVAPSSLRVKASPELYHPDLCPIFTFSILPPWSLSCS